MNIFVGTICTLCFMKINAQLSILNKDIYKIEPHKLKNTPQIYPFRLMPFPFMTDLFSEEISGKFICPKENYRNGLKEARETFFNFPEVQESPQQLTEKAKKKASKDKFITTISEWFIPFQNRKGQSESSNFMKNDFLEDILNDFSFADSDWTFEEKHEKPGTFKHKISKKKYERNMLQNKKNDTQNASKNDYSDNKQSIMTNFPKECEKLIPVEVNYYSSYNVSDGGVCPVHGQCPKGSRCKQASDMVKGENSIKEKKAIVDRALLVCAVLALMGLGATVFGIELLRRHKEIVKQTKFLSQYNKVQNC